MTNKLLVSTFAISACLCQSQPQPTSPVSPKPVPFACNLKAFTPQQRAEHGKLGDRLMPAVLAARERKDGYSLEIDTRKVSLVEVAGWVDLEGKCCRSSTFNSIFAARMGPCG